MRLWSSAGEAPIAESGVQRLEREAGNVDQIILAHGQAPGKTGAASVGVNGRAGIGAGITCAAQRTMRRSEKGGNADLAPMKQCRRTVPKSMYGLDPDHRSGDASFTYPGDGSFVRHPASTRFHEVEHEAVGLWAAEHVSRPCWIVLSETVSDTEIAYGEEGFGPNCLLGLLKMHLISVSIIQVMAS